MVSLAQPKHLWLLWHFVTSALCIWPGLCDPNRRLKVLFLQLVASTRTHIYLLRLYIQSENTNTPWISPGFDLRIFSPNEKNVLEPFILTPPPPPPPLHPSYFPELEQHWCVFLSSSRSSLSSHFSGFHSLRTPCESWTCERLLCSENPQIFPHSSGFIPEVQPTPDCPERSSHLKVPQKEQHVLKKKLPWSKSGTIIRSFEPLYITSLISSGVPVFISFVLCFTLFILLIHLNIHNRTWISTGLVWNESTERPPLVAVGVSLFQPRNSTQTWPANQDSPN